jgi:endonuclease/exonuclease/phosphatase family metal-dependent hydrolase
VKKLSFVDKIIFFLNGVFALLLLLALLVPFIPTNWVPSLSVISLVAQFLVVLNLVFVVYWSLRKKRHFLLSGVLLVLWYVVLGSFYRFSGKEEKTNDDDSFTIMSFNARSFNELKQLDVENIDSLIYDFVTEKNPDIVCFQETYYVMKRNNALSQYKYKYVDFIYGKHNGKVIQSVYSKFPIIKIDSLSFPKSFNNAIYSDILIGMDTVRVYNVHLQSFRIVPGLNTIKNEESSRLFSKSRSVMLKQYEQANLIRKSMAQTSHKKIVVGDFNNTQYSNIYHIIKGDMNDTYMEKGSGFGRTYDLLGFPLRIDYIFADSDFEVVAHKNFNEKLSDHYPIMATLRLSSKQ